MGLQRQILNQFRGDMKTIPNFISPRSEAHKKCFYLGQDIFSILHPLFFDYILSQPRIDEIFCEMCDTFEVMLNTEQYVALEYCVLFREILYYYKDITIMEEEYEMTENLRRFLDLYDKIKIND